MTQTPQPSGTDGHPEVDELADLAEGLVSPARSQELHRHLAECATCREIQEALDGVRGLLGSLPEPAPMPAEIAGRIDAALAAEARYAADVSRETAPPEEQVPAPRESVSRETRPSRSSRRPGSHRADSTGPGRRARRWPRVLLGAAGAAAIVALSVVLIQSPGNDGDDAGGGQADMSAAQENDTKEAPGAASRAPLSASSLESRVLGMLQGQGQQGADTEKGAPRTEGGPFAAEEDVPRVPECVRAAVNRSEAPLAAEPDTYEGTAAYIVVLPHADNPRRVDAYVVDSSCTATPEQPGTVLHRDTFRRH